MQATGVDAGILCMPVLLLFSRQHDSPRIPKSTCLRRSVLFAVLLFSSGDIELNPGPAADNSINIGCLNCRSAIGKIALLHDLIKDENLDLLLLSETWFTCDTPAAILNDRAPAGYSALNAVRPLLVNGPTRGGGLAVVFREPVVVRPHPLANNFHPSTFELQLLRVGLSSSSHVIINIYRPQWMSTVTAFVDELSEVIATLGADCSDNIIVCGDLNCPGVDSTHVDEELADAFDSFSSSCSRRAVIICSIYLRRSIQLQYPVFR